jgi:hypothetical protein
MKYADLDGFVVVCVLIWHQIGTNHVCCYQENILHLEIPQNRWSRP